MISRRGELSSRLVHPQRTDRETELRTMRVASALLAIAHNGFAQRGRTARCDYALVLPAVLCRRPHACDCHLCHNGQVVPDLGFGMVKVRIERGIVVHLELAVDFVPLATTRQIKH